MAHYKRGDLVWAKMKGFPPWPGIITAPPPELKKQPSKKSTLYHCIFFFGTKNYSWIETHKLERYQKGSQPSGKRSVGLREACAAIEAYIETGEGASNFNITPEDDAFDKLVNESKSPPSPVKPKNKRVDEETTEDDGSISDSSSGLETVMDYTYNKETTPDTKRNSAEKDIHQPPTTKTTTISAKEPAATKDPISDSSQALSPGGTQRDLNTQTTNTSGTQPPQDATTTSSQESLQPTTESANLNSTEDQEEMVSLLTPQTANVEEDPLRVDNYIDLAETSNSPEKNSPPKTDFKQPIKPSSTHSSQKKKQIQQVVKARPFRQLTKPRVVERRTSGNENDSRGTTSGTSSSSSSMETTSKKRTYSNSNHESGTEARRKKRQLYSVADTTTPVVHSPYSRRGPASLLFERPPNITRPETPPLDLFTVSQTLLDKHITPSPLRFGFLGLGIMGSGMVKNLLNSGHRVIVWNRSPEKSREFAKVGAEMAVTPQDVCAAADITFSCVSGPKAAKDMVFGNCGALREMNTSKAYVEMTNIDKETSIAIAEAITSRGARYLEAQIQGSKAEADEGSLVILTAGDRSLYNECHSCFEAFGRSSFFLGEVGNATKMNLVIQIIAGITLAGLAEGLALADRSGLQQSDVLEVIGMTSLRSQMITEKGKCIAKCSFPTSLALTHMQKDLKLGLKLGDALEHPLPLTAMTNEMFKHSKRLGYGDHDVSAVYIRARF